MPLTTEQLQNKYSTLRRMSDSDLETAIISATNDKDNRGVYRLLDKLLMEKSRRQRVKKTIAGDNSE